MFDVVNTSATARGFSIEDLTLQQAAGYFITAPSGFPLVGNEAEFIVERPGGDKNNPIDGLFPLANYVWSIWDFCRAQTLSGTSYGQGDTGAGTYHVSMLDDSGKNIISVPSVDKGVQQLSVMDQGCAFRGRLHTLTMVPVARPACRGSVDSGGSARCRLLLRCSSSRRLISVCQPTRNST